MVKVELSYNPYLLETDIKFNGSSPMVNSVVEKYKEKDFRIGCQRYLESFMMK